LTLGGTATPSEGFITTYDWVQTDGPVTTLVGEYPVVSLTDLLPGVYKFELTANDNFGASASDGLVVTVGESKSNPLGAAVVLTPNGDSINDIWYVKNITMTDGCPLTIFNNLGGKVYEAQQYQNDWTGVSKGQLLRDGDYYFVFECGSKKTYSGALRLIR
jgi:gliding motility-associated-like protein